MAPSFVSSLSSSFISGGIGLECLEDFFDFFELFEAVELRSDDFS